jgi:hypothetical protein
MGLDDCQRSAKYLCKNVRTTVAEAAATLTALAAFGAHNTQPYAPVTSNANIPFVMYEQLFLGN